MKSLFFLFFELTQYWNLELFSLFSQGPCVASTTCNDHGACDIENGRCNCYSDYYGPDCSRKFF